MDIIFVLLPLTVLLALFFLGAYLWSVRSGQLDDLETPSRRALFDDSDNKN